MICISVKKTTDGMVVRADGHAGMAQQGFDPVCAGVSALLYGFLAYLEGLSPVEKSESPHLECREADGHLSIATHGLGGADLRGWDVTAAGLALIQAVFPACVQYCCGEGEHHHTTKEVKSEHNA